ncbi:hypothetical protein G3578_06110 [Brevibacillus sp. SYP-B805]|uniref:hypothetical protein n=1 Tax=Brevibacillus sp. SYP-B805 TaxID=1578199 RepID=UPI0013EBDED8|nr:hypothetical protein [Brevibacillus sp. SYP-B805]NGQ94757.1 hypothetical protein [Brevibacillus sp. SYP-B805]
MQVRMGLSMLSEATIEKIIAEQNRRLGSSSDLDLSSRLTSPAYVAGLWEKTTEPEREVARLFLLQAPQGFVSRREWERLVQHAPLRFSLGLTNLRRLGLILTVRKLWSEVGYLMPFEVREMLATMLQRTAPREKTPVSDPVQAPTYYIPSGRGIHLDLIALLLFIREHEVPLTQKKTIHRRALVKLEDLFSLTDAHVAGWFSSLFPPAAKESCSAKTSVILDLALRLSLIRMEQGRLRLVAERVAEWLDAPAAVRWSRIMHVAMSHYLPAHPWLEGAAFAMNDHGHDRWSAVDRLLDNLKRLGYQLPDDALHMIVEQWLHPLLGFGWIQLGHAGNNSLRWRWNPLIRRESEDGWYVQPTGEVLVPPLVSLKRIWELSRLGEVSFAGEMIRCTLEARRIQAYVAQGGTPEQALSFLQDGCIHPLPDSVVEMLHRWGKEAKQIRLERVVRVRVADPRLLQEMRQIPTLQPYLTEIISATDFLVRPEQESELSAVLRRCGYQPLAGEAAGYVGIAREETAAPAPPEESAGLFADQRPWTGYQVENTFPEQDDQTSRLDGLPRMWTRHFQSYHPQTLRDLCRRAAELRIDIRMELASGEERQGTPLEVGVDMGYWVLTLEAGRKRYKYRLDEIRRVQIILPEYC